MAQQTYRQLINKAIQEAGVTLNDIGTGSSFTTPDDTMHKRFKTWVADSWKETQMMYSELEFTIKQAAIKVQPRIYLEQNSTSNDTPAAGAVLIGATSGVKFAVGRKIDNSTADIDLRSGAWASGTAKAYIGITTEGFSASSDYGTPFLMNEQIGLYASDGTTLTEAAFARYKGQGAHDLSVEVTDLLEPRLDTFYVHLMAGDADTDFNQTDYSRTLMSYCRWEDWRHIVGMEQSQGQPAYFSTNPRGITEFYPKPNGPYIVQFHYEGEPQVLSTETEVLNPAMKEQYEDIIVWRAVMHYADYDRKPEVWSRAKKRYDYYVNQLIRKEMPPVTYARSRFR